MSKTVLITGGCGFIGRYLTRQFLSSDWSVTVLDDLSTSTLEGIDAHPRLGIHIGSVLDPYRLAPLVETADLIIHLASVVGVRLAHSTPDYAYHLSVQGTANVLAASRDQSLVLVSSSSVYGIDPRAVVSEHDHCDERSAMEYDGGLPGYATGKLHMEALGREAMEAGRKVMIVRPFNVVGSGQSALYGMVLPTFVTRALQGLPLQVYGDGTQTRSFSDVAVFAAVLERLIGTPAAWTAENAIVNIGNPSSMTIAALGTLVIETCGLGGTLQFVPFESVFPGRKDLQMRCPDSRRIKALVGAITWPDIGEIVRQVVASEQARLSVSGIPSPQPLWISDAQQRGGGTL